MLDAKTLDEIKCNHYLSSPWDSKYHIGRYFSALHEITGPIYIYCGVKIKSQDIKWYKTLHSLHDGFSAIVSLFKEVGIDYQLPKYDLSKPANSFKLLRNVFVNQQKVKHSLINQSCDKNGYEYNFINIKLDNKLSTAEVINKVARYFQNTVTQNNISKWMIPVRVGNELGLEATYIPFVLENNDTESSIKAKIKSSLIKGEHWTNYYLSKVGNFFGTLFLRTVTKKMLGSSNATWLGSVSNMGELGDVEGVEDLFIHAPVRWHRPVGIVLYRINGVQYVTVSVHKSIKNVNLKLVKNVLK